MKVHEFDKLFEEWFKLNIEPSITNPSMVYTTKSIMEKSFLAGYTMGKKNVKHVEVNNG